MAINKNSRQYRERQESSNALSSCLNEYRRFHATRFGKAMVFFLVIYLICLMFMALFAGLLLPAALLILCIFAAVVPLCGAGTPEPEPKPRFFTTRDLADDPDDPSSSLSPKTVCLSVDDILSEKPVVAISAAQYRAMSPEQRENNNVIYVMSLQDMEEIWGHAPM